MHTRTKYSLSICTEPNSVGLRLKYTTDLLTSNESIVRIHVNLE